jgi:hypothetical protein
MAPATHLHLLIDFLKDQDFTFLLDEESPYARSNSRVVFGTDILTLHMTSTSTSLLGFVLLKPEMKDIPGHTVNFLFFVSLVQFTLPQMLSKYDQAPVLHDIPLHASVLFSALSRTQ